MSSLAELTVQEIAAKRKTAIHKGNATARVKGHSNLLHSAVWEAVEVIAGLSCIRCAGYKVGYSGALALRAGHAHAAEQQGNNRDSRSHLFSSEPGIGWARPGEVRIDKHD